MPIRNLPAVLCFQTYDNLPPYLPNWDAEIKGISDMLIKIIHRPASVLRIRCLLDKIRPSRSDLFITSYGC